MQLKGTDSAETWNYEEVRFMLPLLRYSFMMCLFMIQVEDWLKKIKCGEYAEVFKAKYMDGMALSGLLRWLPPAPAYFRYLRDHPLSQLITSSPMWSH